MFKYAILGNATFWTLGGNQADGLVGHLRATVEERIESSPDDFVVDAQTGPLTRSALRAELERDALQAKQPDRLISTVEQWANSNRLLALDPGGPVDEVVCATLMNISLEEPANWCYWEDALELPRAADGRPLPHPNWAKLTCPASVPRAFLPAAAAAHSAAGNQGMELETAAAYTTVLNSMDRPLLHEEPL